MAVLRKIGVVIGLVLFLAVLAAAFLFVWHANAITTVDGPVDVFFLATQNDANCILLKQGETSILVDTGEEVDAPAIVDFLQEHGVQSVDYLVLTHPDKDHIGGAPAILDTFDVGYVIQPYYTKENELLEALNKKIEEMGIAQLYPTRPRTFTCGEMQLMVYPPLEGNYRKDNNYSLGVLVKHENVNMVFAGDAEEKRLGELMQVHWPSVQLYQVANHGRASPSSDDFIKLLHPQYAVCTATGSDSAIQEACEEIGAQLLYTLDGNLHFTSDGNTLTLL